MLSWLWDCYPTPAARALISNSNVPVFEACWKVNRGKICLAVEKSLKSVGKVTRVGKVKRVEKSLKRL